MESDPDPDLNPDPLVRGTDPRTQIRTKISRIRNSTSYFRYIFRRKVKFFWVFSPFGCPWINILFIFNQQYLWVGVAGGGFAAGTTGWPALLSWELEKAGGRGQGLLHLLEQNSMVSRLAAPAST